MNVSKAVFAALAFLVIAGCSIAVPGTGRTENFTQQNAVSESLAVDPEAQKEEDAEDMEDFPVGDYGRFDIPAYDFSVSLSLGMTDGSFDYGLCTEYIDRPYMAAIWEEPCGRVIIGDHNYQGFDVIGICHPGIRAEVTTPDGTVELVCSGIDTDCINDHGLYGPSGEDLISGDVHPGDLLTYTCNSDDGRSVTVCWWTPVAGDFGIYCKEDSSGN